MSKNNEFNIPSSTTAELDSLLKAALENNDEKNILEIIKQGAKPDIALAWALEKGNRIMICEFLDKGANPNRVLEWALEKENRSIIYECLDKGADPDRVLEWALEKENRSIICESLDKGANPDIALESAIAKQNIEIMKIAIEKGADVNLVGFELKDKVKLTAACVAIQNGQLELFDEIVSNLNYNINATNIKDGIRLIDFVKELEGVEPSVRHDKINSLREKGSFEPEILISDNHLINTTITSSPDDYAPNVINAPIILERLYTQFPINTPDVAETINQFRNNCSPEIINIIDGLVSDNSSTATRHSRTVTWDTKKALATIIIACDKVPHLKASLLIALPQLNLCELGKLINLLEIAQNVLPKESILREGANINGCIEYVISKSPGAILKKEKELFLFCQKMLYKNFTHMDTQIKNTTHIDIQKMLSVFNSKLIEIVTSNLKPEYKGELIPSECFIELHNYLAKLSENLVINKQNLSAAEKQLAESYLTGADQYFTEKLIGAADRIKDEPEKDKKDREIIKFFDNISINLEFNCGKLFGLSEASIKTLFNVVVEKKGIIFAKEFMELLIKNVDLSDGVEEFAAHLIKAEYILGEDNIVPTADHTQIIGGDTKYDADH